MKVTCFLFQLPDFLFLYLISGQHNQTHFDVCTPKMDGEQRKIKFIIRDCMDQNIFQYWLNLKSEFFFFLIFSLNAEKFYFLFDCFFRVSFRSFWIFSGLSKYNEKMNGLPRVSLEMVDCRR